MISKCSFAYPFILLQSFEQQSFVQREEDKFLTVPLIFQACSLNLKARVSKNPMNCFWKKIIFQQFQVDVSFRACKLLHFIFEKQNILLSGHICLLRVGMLYKLQPQVCRKPLHFQRMWAVPLPHTQHSQRYTFSSGHMNTLNKLFEYEFCCVWPKKRW